MIKKMCDLIEARQKCYTIGSGKMAFEISSTENQLHGDLKEPFLKCRYVVAFLGFWSVLLLNSLGLQVSVSMVAMVNNSAISSVTQESHSCPNLISNTSDETDFSDKKWKQGEFTWSPELQGYILGSLFLGNFVFRIPAGILCDRFGCKRILFLSAAVTALATLAIPLGSRLSAYCLIALQTLRGITQASVHSAIAVLAAYWFPVNERGFLYPVMLSGTSIGSIVISVVSGYLCEYFGWPYPFYVLGTAIAILSLIIGIFLYDSPKDHPRISKVELEYIINNQENALSEKKQSPPWREMFTSVPVYALFFTMFGHCWSILHFVTVHPTYLGTILHYSIEQNGILSAAPFLCMFVTSYVASGFSSFLERKECASIDHLRKFWTFLAGIGYAVCVICIYLAGCNASLSAVFGIISVGFVGLAFCGVHIAANDMSPNFAGTLTALALTFEAACGFVLPLVVGYLTNEQQTIEQWNKFMFISAAIGISSSIIFVLFGSAEVQPWNFIPEEKVEKKEDGMTRF